MSAKWEYRRTMLGSRLIIRKTRGLIVDVYSCLGIGLARPFAWTIWDSYPDGPDGREQRRASKGGGTARSIVAAKQAAMAAVREMMR